MDYSPAKKNDDSIALSRDEPEHEHVLATAVVAFRDSLSEGALAMEDNFLVLRAHEMVHNMRGRSVAPGVAEPLGTDEAFDNGGR